MFTLAICTILNGYTQVNIKRLLIQSYHTTCVSFSCEFNTRGHKFKLQVRGLLCERTVILMFCTSPETEGEVGPVKLV